MEIIDISLPLFDGMPIYPGTAETKIIAVKSGSGQSFLSEIQMTSHAGTHVDAPAHADETGQTVNQLDLSIFYGPARVLDLTACEESIKPHDLEEKGVMQGERVLFKTRNSARGFKEFRDDFVYLSADGAEYLAQLGVKLVGIDALSIKQRGAKENTSHTALLSRGIPILEGLNLAGAEEGEYKLAAFPIALQADGAPARAVLIKEES
jgi:arylformamidase